MRVILRAALLSMLLVALLEGPVASAQNHPRFTDMDSFVKYVNSHMKAPFDRDSARLPQGAGMALLSSARKATSASLATVHTNVKVNQDRNPWPKAEVGAAVDPTNGNNYVVMSNDFRENWDHMYYHVSTSGGKKWTDDSMVGGADPVTGFIPLTFQSDPGVAFDSKGHSILSTISGNQIFDFSNSYENLDTEIYVVEGFGHGIYTLLTPTPIDDQPCSGTFDTGGTFNCPGSLDKPLITVDNVPGSPHNGTIYVYYTYFCLGTGPNSDQPCTDGNATIPASASAILEAHSPGAGLPFSVPNLVSGSLPNTQFSNLVVDSHGTPHIFFDDFTALPVAMYESTLKAGKWVVSSKPVANFFFNNLASINWGFRSFGTTAPGCGINGDVAYCAFSANQLVGGPAESGVSVYVAVVNTLTAGSKVHRVNDDTFNDGSDHFFPWATAKADGSVYVGWYDDRNDPFNTLVQYFVGKSTDGGQTFPMQTDVSDVAFNPCTGFPGCGFFGDYTQLVSGPDGVVHAAWSDTRDGATMQIYSQAILW